MSYILSFLLQIKEKAMIISNSMLESSHPKVKENWPIILWAGLLVLLTVSALKHYPVSEKKYLFSDQAVHIASALSIWHDQDLVYTLTDLARFRQELPAEPGPRGVFLKVGDDQQLYYAKPFLYALFSAPFVGLLGLSGFLIFNMLCIGAIGAITIKIMRPYFCASNSLLLVCGLLIFSPFLIWTTVAHPDIFIATLLMVGGYFLLRQDTRGTLTLKFIGAFILGLAIYEKPTFAIIVLPLIITQVSQITLRSFFFIVICVLLGWFTPTIVNLLQDGNILSYQGLRFYATGTIGSFPLEENWKGVPAQGVTDKIFDTSALLKAIWGNIGLLPTKFLELFIGRQTGLILYFPVAVILFSFLLFHFTWRTALVLSGFIGYLMIYWLAFPSNGYGGSGSYGPRYTMQALPVIIIAFLVARSGRHITGMTHQLDWKKYIAYGGFFVSVTLQYSVLPPRENLVSTGQFLQSAVARNFPLESSLLPTIYPMLPSGFAEVPDKRNYIFKTGGAKEHCYNIPVTQELSGSKIVIFQRGPLKRIPVLTLTATRDTLVEFTADKKVFASVHVEADKSTSIQLENIFLNSFHDRTRGDIRWRELEVKTKLTSDKISSIPALVRISYLENNSVQSKYTPGILLSSKEFKNNGVESSYCWQPDSHSYWSSGRLAGLEFNFLENITEPFDLKIWFRPYFPHNDKPLIVDLYANEQKVGHYEFRKNDSYSNIMYARLQKELISDRRSIKLLFHIHNPTQPNSTDNRFLGIAIQNISLTPSFSQADKNIVGKIINFKKNSNGDMFLASGWHFQENWGVWSKGGNSSITLPIGNIKEQVQLQFDVQGYVPKEAPFLEVDVFANNVFQKKWNFRNGASQKVRYLDIMPGIFTEDGLLNISFRTHGAKSPKQLGRGKDGRLLGIGVMSLQVKSHGTKE